MSRYKNYLEIIGNLCEKPKYQMSNQGQPRLTFDVAVNEPYKQGDEWKSTVTFFKRIAWGNLATTLNRMNFDKGDSVQVEAKGRNNKWINSQNGENHNEMQFNVTEMRKMAKPMKNESAEPVGKANAKSFSSTTQKMFEEQQAESASGDFDDEGLPF